MAGAVLLLATVPAGAQAAHGAIAFGQITHDESAAYRFAWDYPTRDGTSCGCSGILDRL